MSGQDFTRIRTWIFDLDNTLYSAECDIFPLMLEKMHLYLMRKFALSSGDAHALRDKYYHAYGTTLSGLIAEHAIDPHEFLTEIHDVDLSIIPQMPELGAAIDGLPGRKLIFTNASRGHADAVLAHLRLADRFEAILSIEDTDFVSKPHEAAYNIFCAKHAVESGAACFIDDAPVNLRVPHALGMRTVWMRSGATWAQKRAAREEDFAYIHHIADDLTGWLRTLTLQTARTS